MKESIGSSPAFKDQCRQATCSPDEERGIRRHGEEENDENHRTCRDQTSAMPIVEAVAVGDTMISTAPLARPEEPRKEKEQQYGMWRTVMLVFFFLGLGVVVGVCSTGSCTPNPGGETTTDVEGRTITNVTNPPDKVGELPSELPPNASITKWLREGDFEYVGTQSELGLLFKSFTFETWVFLDQLAPPLGRWAFDNVIFASTNQEANASPSLRIRRLENTPDKVFIYFGFWNGEIQSLMEVDVPLNKWFHVAGSYDFDAASGYGRIRVIYSGTPHDHEPLTQTVEIVPPVRKNGIVGLGSPLGIATHALHGRLAEFRLWNYARSIEETIAERSLVVLPETDSRLTYRFDGR